MKHPITLRAIPSPARLATMKRRARKNGTFVRLLLSEDRDLRVAREPPPYSVYDIRGDGRIASRIDQIVVRLRDGTRHILKNRFPHKDA